jgi:hypothetical protein
MTTQAHLATLAALSAGEIALRIALASAGLVVMWSLIGDRLGARLAWRTHEPAVILMMAGKATIGAIAIACAVDQVGEMVRLVALLAVLDQVLYLWHTSATWAVQAPMYMRRDFGARQLYRLTDARPLPELLPRQMRRVTGAGVRPRADCHQPGERVGRWWGRW